MSRYRKVDPKIWNDIKFRGLTNNGKLSFLFLLTHPHMTMIGAMRETIPGLAAEIGWQEKAFREAFGEALAKGMAKADFEASFIWLPNFLKYNRPESPNVVKSWGECLDLLPECRLKSELIQYVKAFTEALTEGFREALPEAFRKTSLYQEQEQEQEQEQDTTLARRDSFQESSKPTPEETFAVLPCIGKVKAYPVTKAYVSEMKPLYPGIDIEVEILRAKGWLINNPRSQKTFSGMTKFFGNWFSRAQNNSGNKGGQSRPTSRTQEALDYCDQLIAQAEAQDGNQ